MANKTSKTRIIKNPLESVMDIGDPTGIAKGVGSSLVNDLGISGGKDFLEFLGMDLSSTSDKKAQKQPENHHQEQKNGSFDIVSFEKDVKKTEQRIEAAIDYHRDIVRSSEKISHQEAQKMNNQIEQIKSELKSLIASSKMLQMEFAQISMEQTPENVGVYQANFFEWMLGLIRKAREDVETSEAWMNAQKGKHGKKGYWGMFKKHGTSFALSNERGVATQVG